MRELAEEGRGSNNDVDAVDTFRHVRMDHNAKKICSSVLTSFDGNFCVIHVTPDVCQNFGVETKLAYSLAVKTRLFRRRGRSQFDVLDTKGI